MIKGKKLILLLLAFSIFFALPVSFGQAAFAADKPSQWAEPEVYSAIEKMLVPKLLQSNYQANIKRYEYVLLALEVYDIAGKNADIKDNAPFGDVKGHTYELDIVRAYNAGIIKGDGKGSFFPDKNITRQEIASLVVNLLKQISPTRDYNLKSTYPYADRIEIADWAAYYIDYCYENKILNGTGNNKMDPKGNATIEQSIALLYRLANSEQLLQKSAYGTLQIYDDGRIKEIAPKIIDTFVETYSKETFNVIKELTNIDNFDILNLYGQGVSLVVNNHSMSLYDDGTDIVCDMLISDANDKLIVSTYKQLLSAINASEQALLLFDKHVIQMKANESIDSLTQIDKNTSLLVQSLWEPSGDYTYSVTYRISK